MHVVNYTRFIRKKATYQGVISRGNAVPIVEKLTEHI